jgi:hypothetical protein
MVVESSAVAAHAQSKDSREGGQGIPVEIVRTQGRKFRPEKVNFNRKLLYFNRFLHKMVMTGLCRVLAFKVLAIF